MVLLELLTKVRNFDLNTQSLAVESPLIQATNQEVSELVSLSAEVVEKIDSPSESVLRIDGP